MNTETKPEGGQRQRGCNVSMGFNAAVGVVAVAAALLIGYLAYSYLSG